MEATALSATVALWWRRHEWSSSARASATSVASWDALDSEMYSGAGLTLATFAGVVVKAVAEARDGASLAIELAYESLMLVAAADGDTPACAEEEPKGAVMLRRTRQTQSSLLLSLG